MLKQFAVETPTLPVDQMFFPPHPILGGMLRQSFVSPSRGEGLPSIWDTHGISGNVFVDPPAFSSALYLQELNQWNSSIDRSIHLQWRKVKGKNKIKIWDASQDRQTLQRIMEQTNNYCRFLIFTLISSLHQQPLFAVKICGKNMHDVFCEDTSCNETQKRM